MLLLSMVFERKGAMGARLLVAAGFAEDVEAHKTWLPDEHTA